MLMSVQCHVAVLRGCPRDTRYPHTHGMRPSPGGVRMAAVRSCRAARAADRCARMCYGLTRTSAAPCAAAGSREPRCAPIGLVTHGASNASRRQASEGGKMCVVIEHRARCDTTSVVGTSLDARRHMHCSGNRGVRGSHISVLPGRLQPLGPRFRRLHTDE